MTIVRRVLQLAGLLAMAGIAYVFLGFATAEDRVRGLCNQMQPGMPVAELRAFAAKHGLGPRPPNASGVSYLVENRTFGRFGCKVALAAGIVSHAEYSFVD